MKIAVVGSGAVGSFYGAKLARAGHDVHFLLRSDYDVVRREGLRIRSFEGDFHLHPRSARHSDEIGQSDLVLIGLKTTANALFPHALPPLVGPDTAILTLQNGLGNEELLARLFPPTQILGGLCFVCLNRLAPGLVHHIAHGQIIIGEFQRPPQPRTHEIAEHFRHAGVPCGIAEDLARAHWEKLVWNIPFNGLGVAGSAGYEAVISGQLTAGRASGSCLPTDQLLADSKWEKLVRDLMLEVISSARALGHDLSESLVEKNIQRTLTMGAYKASTLLDFERGQPLELESLFMEPVRQAAHAHAATPRLEALCRVLTQLGKPTP